MLRISLVIALIAGLATGAIGIVKVKEKIVTTMNDRDTEKGMKEVAQKDLAKTKTDLKDTDEKLKATEQNLASTEAELSTVTFRSEELEKQKIELAETLQHTRADRDTAQRELMKWDIVDIKPEQVKSLIENHKKAIIERDTFMKENKVMAQNIQELKSKIAYYLGENSIPELPDGLTGKIVAVDPKFQFVILNIGGNNGVIARGQMLVNRNGKLVGKISIATVDSDRCVANIMPEWQHSELLEGDAVITTSVNL